MEKSLARLCLVTPSNKNCVCHELRSINLAPCPERQKESLKSGQGRVRHGAARPVPGFCCAMGAIPSLATTFVHASVIPAPVCAPPPGADRRARVIAGHHRLADVSSDRALASRLFQWRPAPRAIFHLSRFRITYIIYHVATICHVAGRRDRLGFDPLGRSEGDRENGRA